MLDSILKKGVHICACVCVCEGDGSNKVNRLEKKCKVNNKNVVTVTEAIVSGKYAYQKKSKNRHTK